eukprot:146200-Rhodomonas_salina.2
MPCMLPADDRERASRVGGGGPSSDGEEGSTSPLSCHAFPVHQVPLSRYAFAMHHVLVSCYSFAIQHVPYHATRSPCNPSPVPCYLQTKTLMLRSCYAVSGTNLVRRREIKAVCPKFWYNVYGKRMNVPLISRRYRCGSRARRLASSAFSRSEIQVDSWALPVEKFSRGSTGGRYGLKESCQRAAGGLRVGDWRLRGRGVVCKVQSSCFQASGSRVQGSGQGSGLRAPRSGLMFFRVRGSGCRAPGSGFTGLIEGSGSRLLVCRF